MADRRIVPVVLVVLAAWLVLAAVMAFVGPWGHHDGWTPAWWPAMGLMMVVPIALVVLLVYLLAGAGPRDPTPGTDARRALARLDERYAGGEIDREAYLRMRDDLRR